MYREKILQNDLVVDLLKSQNFESIDNNFCHVVFYDGNNVHPKREHKYTEHETWKVSIGFFAKNSSVWKNIRVSWPVSVENCLIFHTEVFEAKLLI